MKLLGIFFNSTSKCIIHIIVLVSSFKSDGNPIELLTPFK